MMTTPFTFPAKLKIYLVVLLALCYCGRATGQSPKYQWANKIGGSFLDAGKAVALGKTGTVWATGSFFGRVDFDPGSDTAELVAEGSDIYVVKYTADGQYQWAINMGGPGGGVGLAIALDDQENVYVTGQFQGTEDFDPDPNVEVNLTSLGGLDIFIAKYDVNGKYVWAKSMGGSGISDGGYGIALDTSGHIYITGNFNSTVDFDPGPDTFQLKSAGIGSFAGNNDLFFAKYDNDGNFEWAKRVGGDNQEYSTSIALDPAGNLWITGAMFSDPIDFNPGPGIANLTGGAGFIAQYNTNGEYLWAGRIGGVGNGIKTDIEGNIYVTGSHSGTADFDPGPGIKSLVASSINIFLAKYNSSGNYVWAQSMGSDNIADVGRALALDDYGNIYVTGYYQYTGIFNPGTDADNITSNGGNDLFIGCFDNNGKYKWVVGLGGTGPEVGNGIAVDAAGNVVVTGDFFSTVDFDPSPNTANLVSSGNYESFVLKLSTTCHTLSGRTVSACNQYTLGNQTYTKSGTYIQRITGFNNCDSIVVVSLTIGSNVSDTQSVSACDSYALNGVVYRNPGIYKQTYTNAGGCDSILILDVLITSPEAAVRNSGDALIANTADGYQWLNCADHTAISGAITQKFEPTERGSYAVVITLNDCKDTSDCYPFIPSSIKDPFAGQEFQIYPNPTDGKLTVEARHYSSRVAQVKVTNLLGQVSLEKLLRQGDQLLLDLTDYPTGIYFCELLEQGKSVAIFKVLKR